MVGSDTIGLLFRAKGDTSDAKKSFNDLEKSVNKDVDAMKAGIESSTADSGKGLDSLGDSTRKLGVDFNLLGAVAAGASAVVVGVGIAAVVVGKQLFDLAKGAGEAGAEIDKFQKLTSLSTDTIQALKVATEQAGGSLEDIEETWESFSELMVEAARGEEDAILKLKQNGINHKEAIKDLEGTYTKAIKIIAEMPPGLKQNAAAMDLMGESGLRMINVAKAAGGDIEAFTKKLKEQGVIMDAEGVRKSKEFNLQLKALSQQVSGIATNIGVELIPTFKKAGTAISNFIKENRSDIIQLGKATGVILGDIFSGIGKLIEKIREYKTEVKWFIEMMAKIDPVSAAALQYGQGVYERTGKISGSLEYQPESDSKLTDAKKQKEDAEKAEKERKDRLSQQIGDLKRFNDLEIETARQKFEAIADANEDNIERTLKALEEMRDRVLNIMAESQRLALKAPDLSEQARKNLELEYKNAIEKFNAEINNQAEDFRKKQADKDKKAAEDEIKNAETKNARLIELEKSRAQTDLAEKEKLKNQGVITEFEYATAVARIRGESLAYERKLLADSLAGLDTRGGKYAEVMQKISLLDQEIARQQIESQEAIQKAIEETTNAYDSIFRQSTEGAPGEEGGGDSSEPGNPNDVQGRGIFGGWSDSFETFFGLLQNNLPTVQSMLTDFAGTIQNAFEGITNAVGSLVENWVLMGDTGPAMFRKILAAALASIAAESAVRAIFELAKGFAALFFNPAEAAAHFTAAALFGSISVGSALIGRAVAGNAFKQQTSGAYGSSSTSAQDAGQGGDVYSVNRDKQILNMSRNASATIPEQQILIRDKSGLFGEFFEIEVLRNGKVRDVIRKTVSD